MASAARRATPPTPPVCPSLAWRFSRATSPGSALPSAMRFWCSGLMANRPTARQASLSMSSLRSCTQKVVSDKRLRERHRNFRF
eukprot:1178912-Prorocentrum_minimum.AAC.4